VSIDDGFADGQAETKMALLAGARFVGAVETLENMG